MINYLFTIPVSFMYDHKMLLNITYLYIIKKTNGTVNCIHTNLMTLFQSSTAFCGKDLLF